MKRILLIVTVSISIQGMSQQNTMLNVTSTPTENPDLFTIGGGVGFLSFFGDIDRAGSLSTYTNIRPGYFFNAERRFGKIVGVSAEGIYGKVAFSERSQNATDNRSFESPLLHVGISVFGHMDNDYIIHKNSPFSPYFGVGVAFITFDPHGDLKDANNNSYYYWSDGSIMNMDENDPNAANATVVHRDYVYETQLKDSLSNYSRSSLSIPLTVGFKWKFFDNIQGRIFATYSFSRTDWMDNFENGNNNDKYLYTAFSINYLIHKKNKNAAPGTNYDDVDFVAMEKADNDGDGVKDMNDFCPQTPKGVRVDGDGCPVDSDKDGVPDYKDKELNTVKGSIVDPKTGITLTDEDLAARRNKQDSVAVIRSQVFANDPSLQTLRNMDSDIIKNHQNQPENNLPERYKEADLDNDGIISSKEINSAIDNFFEGSISLSVKDLHDLIDYFFEQ